MLRGVADNLTYPVVPSECWDMLNYRQRNAALRKKILSRDVTAGWEPSRQ